MKLKNSAIALVFVMGTSWLGLAPAAADDGSTPTTNAPEATATAVPVPPTEPVAAPSEQAPTDVVPAPTSAPADPTPTPTLPEPATTSASPSETPQTPRAEQPKEQPSATSVRTLARRAQQTEGVTASAILLPIGDSIGDVTAVTVATAALSPDTDYSGTHSFSIRGSGSDGVIRSIPLTGSTRYALDDRNVCDPVDVQNFVVDPADCADVQDVWEFNWDGKSDAGTAVVPSNYRLFDETLGGYLSGSIPVKTTTLSEVRSSIAGPILIAPYRDGLLDSVSVTLKGFASGVAITTIGNVELTDLAGSKVLDRFDFATPKKDHVIRLGGYPMGSYTLTVALESGGVQKTRAFSVRVVRTEVTSAKVIANSSQLFPRPDGYRDSVSLTIGGVTSLARDLPVTGSVEIKQGTKLIRKLPVIRLGQVITWNGRSGTKSLPAGSYTATARVKGPEGSVRASAPVTVRLVATRLINASLNLSTLAVFPVKDGYQDTTKITVSGLPNVDSGYYSVPVSGSVSVFRGTKSVWTRTISANGNEEKSVTWNGRVGSKLQTGTFKVKLQLKGPEGSTLTRVATVTVSGKKLVTKTVKGKTSYAPRQLYDGGITTDYGTIANAPEEGDFDEGNFPNTIELYNGIDSASLWDFSAALPEGTTSFRVITKARTTDALYGLSYCGKDGADPDDCTVASAFTINKNGGATFTSPWTSKGVADGYADFHIITGDWGFLYVGKFVVEYKRTYKVLQ